MGTTNGGRAGLSGALFGKTRQRVLAMLYGQPERTFHSNEVVRLAASGVGAVQRELASLESAGLVVATHVGNQKHFRANRAAPIFEELRAIVIKTFGIGDVLRKALAPVAERVRVAFIYGSVAKGSDTATSDIDLMIVGENLSYPDLFTAIAEVEGQVGRKISPMVYTPDELRQRISSDNAFLERVISQPKIFLIGSDDDLRQPRKSGPARQGAKGRSAGRKGV